MDKLKRIIGLAPSEDPEFFQRLQQRRSAVVATLSAFRLNPKRLKYKKPRKKKATVKDLTTLMKDLGVSLEDIQKLAEEKA